MAYKDLDTIPELEQELTNIQTEHGEKQKRLLDLQKET